MLESALKYMFFGIVGLYILMTVYGKLFVFRKKAPAFVSNYCATMAFVLGFYIIFSLLFVCLLPSHFAKFIMFCFALSPFLYGLVATFNTEKYFTTLQLITMALTVVYIF